MAGVHELKKSEEHSFAFPQYRHFRECQCGFQTRQATAEQADSQFEAHQAFHGYVPLTEEEKAAPKNTQELEAQNKAQKTEEKKGNGGSSGNNPLLDKLS